MLGLAEYSAISAQLLKLGKDMDAVLTEKLEGVENKQRALLIARESIPAYIRRYRVLLDDAMSEVAFNAARHYHYQVYRTHDNFDSDEIMDLVKRQYGEKYYGLSLNQRLYLTERRLGRRATQSSSAGVDALKGLYTDPTTFGAQVMADRRLLQGTAVKIEQDVAKHFAEKGDIDLIKWRISHRHSKSDICDDYASIIDRNVVAHIEKHGLDVDPTGVYFTKSLPAPPHPNCQCEYGLVTGRHDSTGGFVRRTLSAISSIIRRLRGK